MREMSSIIGVSFTTIRNWIGTEGEFRDLVDSARDVADGIVEATLFHRAIGYSAPAVKIFYDSNKGEVVEHHYTEHYPPDVTAMIFWLKNRQPEIWREKQEITHKTKDIKIEIDDDDRNL